MECMFYLGSGKTAAFLVPILAQIYTIGPQGNNSAAPKPAVSYCKILSWFSIESSMSASQVVLMSSNENQLHVYLCRLLFAWFLCRIEEITSPKK